MNWSPKVPLTTFYFCHPVSPHSITEVTYFIIIIIKNNRNHTLITPFLLTHFSLENMAESFVSLDFIPYIPIHYKGIFQSNVFYILLNFKLLTNS